MPAFQQSLNQFNQKLNAFFSFVGNKFKNFRNLTLGEQISYSSVGAGFVLVLVSIVMFIL